MALALVLAACGGGSGAAGGTATATTVGADPLAGAELVQALRGGGHVIFFRHAATTRRGQPDDDLTSCASQRNLNAAGRAEARAVGAAFETRDIPVGTILTSEFCRTRDTAVLAFGRVDDELPELNSAAGRSPDALLSAPPAPGTNTVIVGHLMPAVSGLRLPLLDEGGAAVLVPSEDQGFAVLATLTPADWAALPR